MLFGMASKALVTATCLPPHPTLLLLPFMLLGTSSFFCLPAWAIFTSVLCSVSSFHPFPFLG